MIEIDKKQIKLEAKQAFENKDYSLAFQILWKLGVSDFLSFGLKPINHKKNINWFTHPDTFEIFWEQFLSDKNIFNEIFESDYSERLLFCYFSLCEKQSTVFETKLSKEFPQKFITAVRVNQVFLKSEKIYFILSLCFESDEHKLHQKLWKEIYNNELEIWQNIQKKLDELSVISINDILFHTLIWLETKRFKLSNQYSIQNLAYVYSFFIELILKKFPEKSNSVYSSEEFYTQYYKTFYEIYRNPVKIEESTVATLLNYINHWFDFKDKVISPYSYDLNRNPVQEDELLFLKTSAEAHYKWLINGVRYEFNELIYLFKGINFVEDALNEGIMSIPGKTGKNLELSKSLVSLKYSVLFLLEDLAVDCFKIGNESVQPIKLIDPLMTYSFNRMIRYENEVKQHNLNSTNWLESHNKLFLDSINKNIRNEPFFFMPFDEYKELNQVGLSSKSEDYTTEVVNLFSYKVKQKSPFNRLNNHYNVWLKPFINIGNILFCPMMFFANRSWFYYLAQTALFQKTERYETENMENQLGDRIKQKGWDVKVIKNEESNNIKGDVDIFVEDDDNLLFIQLKRTYFRLNMKDSYNEFINTDLSAAKQLNEAEAFLSQNNPIYKIKHKPVKWIVSTSFERVNENINDCRKINYFEFLNAIDNPYIKTINDLIKEFESEKNLIRFINVLFNKEIDVNERLQLSEFIIPLATFETKNYKTFIFTDDEKKSENYNSCFNQALTLDQQGNKKEALLLFDKCISLKPNEIEPLGAKANVLADLGDYDNSFLSFKKALELFPDDPFITRYYFLALYENKKHYEAFVLLITLLRKFPLLADIKRIFDTYFEQCLKDGLLKNEQILELKTEWDNLYT